jgi:hypothetical protein
MVSICIQPNQTKSMERHRLSNGSDDAPLINGSAPLHFFLIRFCFAATPLVTANGPSAQNMPLDVAMVDLTWF